MNGKTIDLTAEEIKIQSNNFNVDEQGNVSLKDANFTIDIRPPHDFTSQDVDIVINYLDGLGTLTPEQIALYDLNKNGEVDGDDYAIIYFWSESNITTTEPGILELNGTDASALLSIKDSDNKVLTRIGVDGIYTQKLIVENKQVPDIMTLKLDANYTIPTANTYQQLYMIEHIRLGSKIMPGENGTVEIGSGVSCVKVSFHVHFNTVSTAGLKWATLYINENAEVPIPIYSSNRTTLSSGEVVLPVSEGDIISLQVQGAKNDVIRSGLYTALTVEAIA